MGGEGKLLIMKESNKCRGMKEMGNHLENSPATNCYKEELLMNANIIGKNMMRNKILA